VKKRGSRENLMAVEFASVASVAGELKFEDGVQFAGAGCEKRKKWCGFASSPDFYNETKKTKFSFSQIKRN